MESAQAKVAYVTYAKVLHVEQKFRHDYVKGYGDNAEFKATSLGYFLYMEGSYEALSLGHEKPDIAVGDRVKITIEKTPHAQP